MCIVNTILVFPQQPHEVAPGDQPDIIVLPKKGNRAPSKTAEEVRSIVTQYLSKEPYWTDTKEDLLRMFHPKSLSNATQEFKKKTGDTTITANELYVRFMGFLKNEETKLPKRTTLWNKNTTHALQELITPYLQKHHIPWSKITKELNKKIEGKFSHKQVRERCVNYIDPALNWSPLEKQEKITILTYVKDHGTHWVKIKQLLKKNRSELFIKNWFYSFITLLKAHPYPISPVPEKAGPPTPSSPRHFEEWLWA